MLSESKGYKQHVRSKLIEEENSVILKKPKRKWDNLKLGISNRKGKNKYYLPLLNITYNNVEKDNYIESPITKGRYVNTSLVQYDDNDNGINRNNKHCSPTVKPIRRKTHCLKESKTMLQLIPNYPLITNSSSSKDCINLIKQSLNDNNERNNDHHDNDVMKPKYNMKDLRIKINEMQRKVKLIKGVCDYACPLLFVARNNILSINKKNVQPNTKANENNLYKDNSVIPVSSIYSTKV